MNELSALEVRVLRAVWALSAEASILLKVLEHSFITNSRLGSNRAAIARYTLILVIVAGQLLRCPMAVPATPRPPTGQSALAPLSQSAAAAAWVVWLAGSAPAAA